MHCDDPFKFNLTFLALPRIDNTKLGTQIVRSLDAALAVHACLSGVGHI